MSAARRFVLAGGGSGGHLFPLVAVADALRRELPGAECVFVGTERGIEARVLPSRGERLELLDVRPIKGAGVRGAVKGVSRAAASLPEAARLVKRLAPEVVLSVGGYAAGPVSLAARLLGVPLALLEPNSTLGLTNFVLSPLASRAYVAFDEVGRRFRPSVVRPFGVPLRPGFEPSPYRPVAGRARLVVLGGSQGSEGLNRALPEAAGALAREVRGLTIVHQAGRGRADAVRAAYGARGLGGAAEVVEFADDVPGLLASADLVLARAGAGTLAELCAVGRASLLVPYPFARDDHQRKNAEALAAAGGAAWLRQQDATPGRLARELSSLLVAPERLAAMAEAAARRGAPGAAARVARDLVALADRRRAA
ncbi:MAG TPA: UDP-N-acetylglucosamine--N-acetylmuramyl-(pentapeptide) pyrophosphoryl-undecaprenol N-acetylglucosamine transferase [Polyangiaceae bacterium]|nr:UDP-N-acetylglucosamine--N-acetylmuramyl-(pentapeptide) pyrophosphoryl-undecaprenol N-acetylglucosamine transferase [Polyangiaceae bacterium]